YELLDGVLQRQPDGTWHERQEQPRGREVLYEYKQTNVTSGKIDYRRLDNTVDLFVDFPQRKICWRESAAATGAGEYRCPSRWCGSTERRVRDARFEGKADLAQAMTVRPLMTATWARQEFVQSTLMRAVLTTLPHFSISLAMYVPNSAGVISIGSAPK